MTENVKMLKMADIYEKERKKNQIKQDRFKKLKEKAETRIKQFDLKKIKDEILIQLSKTGLFNAETTNKINEILKPGKIQKLESIVNELPLDFSNEAKIKELLIEAKKIDNSVLEHIKKLLIEKKLKFFDDKYITKLYNEVSGKSIKSKTKKTNEININQSKKERSDELKPIILKEGNTYSMRLIRSETGVYLEYIDNKSNTIEQILTAPFDLKKIYEIKNNNFLYLVQLGNEELCLTKSELIRTIDNNRLYSRVSVYRLKEIITILLQSFKEEKQIIPEKSFSTIGVFINEKNELIVVYPNVVKMYGENDFQRKVISYAEEKGLDLTGELTETYYNIINLNSIPEMIRIVIAGHSTICPFFYVLKDYIDIYPPHFWINPAISFGRTRTFEIFYNELMGTKMESNDNMNTNRLTKLATAYTGVINIDNISSLDIKVINQIIIQSTSRIERERMRKDQSVESEETYASYVGTANKFDFLQKDSAFIGRCLISTDIKEISLESKNKFDSYQQTIKSGKIYGYYLLKKSIEFIVNSINDNSLTSYQKLIKLIEVNKETIIKFLDEYNKNYDNKIKINDTRRYTIYALIYTGLQFWNYVFEDKGLKTQLLTNYIDNIDNTLIELIKKYENNSNNYNYEEISIIIDFLHQNFGKFAYYRDKDNIVVLKSDFVREFNNWGFKSFEKLSLANIGELQSIILRKDIKPKTIRYKNILEIITEAEKDKLPLINWGVSFYYEELRNKLGIETTPYDEEIKLFTPKDMLEKIGLKLIDNKDEKSGEKEESTDKKKINIFQLPKKQEQPKNTDLQKDHPQKEQKVDYKSQNELDF